MRIYLLSEVLNYKLSYKNENNGVSNGKKERIRHFGVRNLSTIWLSGSLMYAVASMFLAKLESKMFPFVDV